MIKKDHFEVLSSCLMKTKSYKDHLYFSINDLDREIEYYALISNNFSDNLNYCFWEKMNKKPESKQCYHSVGLELFTSCHSIEFMSEMYNIENICLDNNSVFLCYIDRKTHEFMYLKRDFEKPDMLKFKEKMSKMLETYKENIERKIDENF